MAPVTEDDLLREAMDGTEREIFSEATGKDAPSTEGGPGDRSVEEMGTGLEGQLEADADGEGGEVAAGEGEQPAGEVEQPRDPKTGEFVAKPDGDKPPAKAGEAEKPVDPKARVPLSELMGERKTRQGLETRLAETEAARVAERNEAQQAIKQLNDRIDLVLKGQQPKPPTPAADAPQEPDIFADPDAFLSRRDAALEQKFQRRFVEGDMRRAHRAQPEVFEKAYAALTSLNQTDAADRLQVQKIFNSPTPGDDMIDWYNEREALRVIGKDPTAYAAKVKADALAEIKADPEFRKTLLAELRGAASPPAPGQQQAPTGGAPPVFRMPRSLNGASGGQSGGAAGDQGDNSDRGVFEDAFRN